MSRLLLWLGGFCLAALAVPGQTAPGSERMEFRFREPRQTVYHVERANAAAARGRPEWITGWRRNRTEEPVSFGDRVVVQLEAGADLAEAIRGRPLQVARVIDPNLFILQAADAWGALEEAQRLADRPGVRASCPVMRRPAVLHGPYAFKPDDPYFHFQWHLEARDSDATLLGVDLNVRAAWPFTRGAGVLVAVADNGMDLAHPDLAARVAGGPHFNFVTGQANGGHPSTSAAHGTAVAGLVAAGGGNGVGGSGVAPEAGLASWVLFAANGAIASDEALMDMYQYQSNTVSVQNHSWGNPSLSQFEVPALEQAGIERALTEGRGGRGVVMVRSGGNDRLDGGNANDDGYHSDPRIITVGAVRFDGRAAGYSSPGACLLVAAPSGGDDGFPTLFTTDRVGPLGYNQLSYPDDPALADYGFNAFGFTGTSGSAPLVSGVAALILSVNPNLTIRDVQQILLLSARHVDLADPDVRPNGAGLLVSHNAGFGIPDAAQAVALAQIWPLRPPQTNVTYTLTNSQAVIDDGLRVVVTGMDIPVEAQSIPAVPSLGPHPDDPTAAVPLVDVGPAINPILTDLTGKGAFIARGGSLFREKIEIAAQAGAAFAVVWNANDAALPVAMGGTDFVPIPAVLIDFVEGAQLRDLIQSNASVRAQLRLLDARYEFAVPDTLWCEHVAVRVRASHPVRGDLRITVRSPRGTRSVLQRLSTDFTPGPDGWTYLSTQHFYESSAGMWTVSVTDESAAAAGSVEEVSLILHGVPITDADHDGLADEWELAHFDSLAQGPVDDPDNDGRSHAREQVMGTDPNAKDIPFRLDLSLRDERLTRLSWPSVTNRTYEVIRRTNLGDAGMVLTNLPGRFPETDVYVPHTNPPSQFFQVREVAP